MFLKHFCEKKILFWSFEVQETATNMFAVSQLLQYLTEKHFI